MHATLAATWECENPAIPCPLSGCHCDKPCVIPKPSTDFKPLPRTLILMSAQPRVVSTAFDYATLDANHARSARGSTEKIRGLMLRTVENIVEIGKELVVIKGVLPHGRFLEWISAEFGWKERMARHFMNVAERFKSANFAEIEMDVSAAYLLAAPSTPEEARQEALKRAEKGERVSHDMAAKLVATHKSGKARPRDKPGRVEEPAERLRRTLERYRAAWPAKSMKELVQVLREFLAELEQPRGEKRRSKALRRKSA